MTSGESSFDALISAREQLVSEIRSHLNERSKQFLLSFHELKPDWSLLVTPDISDLPAIRWKLMNIELLQAKQPEKYRAMLYDLATSLANGQDHD